MSSSLQKMRDSMKSKTSMFKSTSGKQVCSCASGTRAYKPVPVRFSPEAPLSLSLSSCAHPLSLSMYRQVEALRDNLQLVGAQKVLHEQQAEMWKQKYAAMDKLVDHLEVLVASQQQQLLNTAPPPLARAITSSFQKQVGHSSGAADPDHVSAKDTRAWGGGAAHSPRVLTVQGNVFENVVMLSARQQDVQAALRMAGVAGLQEGTELALKACKLAAYPADPTVESLEDFCFPTQVPASLVPSGESTRPLRVPVPRKQGDPVDDHLQFLGLTRAFFRLSTGLRGDEQLFGVCLYWDDVIR
jgi:hypothetical protein